MKQEFDRLSSADQSTVSALWAQLDEEGRAIVKRQVMAHRVLELRSAGATPEAAIDTVCGAGTWEKMTSDIHNAVNA